MAAVRIFFVCIVKIRLFLAKKNIYKKLHLTAARERPSLTLSLLIKLPKYTNQMPLSYPDWTHVHTHSLQVIALMEEITWRRPELMSQPTNKGLFASSL